MNTVNRLLSDFQGKLDFFTKEQKSFQERFQKAEGANIELQNSINEKKVLMAREFAASLNMEIDETGQELLAFPLFTKEIEEKLLTLMESLLSKRIIASKSALSQDTDNRIDIRNLVSGDVLKVDGIQDLQDLQDIRNLVPEMAKNYFPDDETGRKKSLVIMLALKLIKPTVTENKLEFEKKKSDAIANMSPIYFSVKKGEIIARAGDRGTRHQVELIRSYYEMVSNKDKLPQMVGVVLIVLISLLLVSFVFQIQDGIPSLSFKNQMLIMSGVLITLILVKGGVVLGEIVETRYTDLPREIYTYMLPIALSSMLVGILINFECGVVAGLLTGLYAAIMLQGSLTYFFFAMMGSVVASLPVTRFESRYSLLTHGLKISMINLPVVIIIYLIERNQSGNMIWLDIFFALCVGLLTAIVASILLPFFESIFDVTTNLKLLELSNMNNPVLKDLIFKAPGTYQHSIIVGNLAESGALKIGANSLLTRVASYYHDIGKMDAAHFFVENQTPNMPNIHDTMAPLDSATMIIGHLHKGAKIAEKYRLGSAIKNIMIQHHGTNRVEYFYNKALQNPDQSENQMSIDENRFRYPGPKPQNLEAAVVMMADIAEAATRSLDNPTTESITEMVKKVCWNLLRDGQLDESGLTLQTFHQVVQVYSKLLISIHHQRIEYPESSGSSTTDIPVTQD
ncbi:MAG: HDIG domain-containing metalloprotein [bacterium]